MAFYDFREIVDMKSFKGVFREKLDSLAMPSSLADEMVVEANFAFEANTAIFVELDCLSGFDTLKPTIPAISGGEDAAGRRKTGGGCPFASLAAAGVPIPKHHPKTQAEPENATLSKCPLHSFRAVDAAIVLFIAALMLLMMPSKAPP